MFCKANAGTFTILLGKSYTPSPAGGTCVCLAEGFIVFSAVCDQIGALTEGLTAHFTHMRLLT